MAKVGNMDLRPMFKRVAGRTAHLGSLPAAREDGSDGERARKAEGDEPVQVFSSEAAWSFGESCVEAGLIVDFFGRWYDHSRRIS